MRQARVIGRVFQKPVKSCGIHFGGIVRYFAYKGVNLPEQRQNNKGYGAEHNNPEGHKRH